MYYIPLGFTSDDVSSHILVRFLFANHLVVDVRNSQIWYCTVVQVDCQKMETLAIISSMLTAFKVHLHPRWPRMKVCFSFPVLTGFVESENILTCSPVERKD